MVTQMNPLNIFKKKTNYPKQQLPPKAVALIERLDTALVEESMVGEHFSIIHIVIGMMDQIRSVDTLLDMTLKLLTDNFMYLPRSIAFTVDNSGNWNLFISVYRPIEVTFNKDIASTMFIDLLARTNNARMEIEQYDKKDTV
jgi:hypothetical protein